MPEQSSGSRDAIGQAAYSDRRNFDGRSSPGEGLASSFGPGNVMVQGGIS